MKINCGAAVAQVLKEQGVTAVFGIPGGQTLYVTDPMPEAGIHFVATRHEGVAAAAADAWGRLTGRPGVCLATTGPGATNLITGLGGALRDSSPVIALIFNNRAADIGRGDAQECDHEGVFSPMCKKYIPVRHADSLLWSLREAYRVAMSGKKGPVVVDLYRDVIENMEVDYSPTAPDSYYTPDETLPGEGQLHRAVELLTRSEKVCILSGNGVKTSRSGTRVLALAQALRAPVVTTFNGISSVPTDHPLVFGARSRHGSTLTRAVLEEADLVLVLGSSLSAVSTNRWGLALKNIIQVDCDQDNIGRHYPVRVGLKGELTRTLDALLAELSGGTEMPLPAREKWLGGLEEKRTEWLEAVKAGADVSASPAVPAAVMAELGKCLKENSVVVCDAGNPGAWSHLLPMREGMFYMKPVNYGNMGFAVPGAIAAKILFPEREVIALLGDGSLGMTLGDLETAAREKLPIIFLVMNDAAFGNIRQEQLFKFGDHRYVGVDLSALRYDQVAKALGCEAVRVESAAHLPAAIGRARACTDKPFLIDMAIDGAISVWPEAF